MKFLSFLLAFVTFTAWAEDPSRLFIQFSKGSDLFVTNTASTGFTLQYTIDTFQSYQAGSVSFTGYNDQSVKVVDFKSTGGFSLSFPRADPPFGAVFARVLDACVMKANSLSLASATVTALTVPGSTNSISRAIRFEISMKKGFTIPVNVSAMSVVLDPSKIFAFSCVL